MILADLHIHSTFSDGKLTIPELVDFYGLRGFGCIAITDHICERNSVMGRAAHHMSCTLTPATYPLYIEIIRSEAERAWRQFKMLVLPGFELSKNSFSNHRSAHILGIGVSEYISADLDIIDQLKALRKQNALTVAAHPVWTRKFEKQSFHLWDRREELSQYFDAWEVASGVHLFPEVEQSGLPMVANSDLHRPEHIQSWKTLIDSELHPEAVIAAVREQRIRFHFFEERKLHEPFDLSGSSSLGPGNLSSNQRHLSSIKAFSL